MADQQEPLAIGCWVSCFGSVPTRHPAVFALRPYLYRLHPGHRAGATSACLGAALFDHDGWFYGFPLDSKETTRNRRTDSGEDRRGASLLTQKEIMMTTTTGTSIDKRPVEHCPNCGRVIETTGHRCPLPLDASATAVTPAPTVTGWEPITKSGADN